MRDRRGVAIVRQQLVAEPHGCYGQEQGELGSTRCQVGASKVPASPYMSVVTLSYWRLVPVAGNTFTDSGSTTCR